MSLRPILKPPSNPHSQRHHPPAVHFPPSTSLTRTFVAHSSSTYDRSPIVVAPNSCALPERGCPGRTYGLDDPPSHTSGHYHPRALTLIHLHDHVSDDSDQDDPQRTPTHFSLPPPLIPDISSESDESDITPQDIYSPPDTGLSIILPKPDRYYPYTTPFPSCNPFNGLNRPTTPTALSFLPHPPSPPSSHHQYISSEDELVQKPRRSRPRRRDRSRDRDRIRSSTHFDHHDSHPSSPSLLPSPTKTSFRLDDQDIGCLDGF